MNKSIIKRAFAYEYANKWEGKDICEAYEDGANDQLAIDIDKACKWFFENIKEKICGDGDGGVYEHFFTTEMENEFRWYMQSEEPQQTCEDAQLNCDKSNK